MICKRCGKKIHPVYGANVLWVHTENNTMMCFHDSVPMFATPYSTLDFMKSLKSELARFLL